ncbi:hypothetical protein BD414DRAFT_498396 [Trametes punicea]|nr:hypothetical protein BD414DRAFT_498396 [Trametes punicea]
MAYKPLILMGVCWKIVTSHCLFGCRPLSCSRNTQSAGFLLLLISLQSVQQSATRRSCSRSALNTLLRNIPCSS